MKLIVTRAHRLTLLIVLAIAAAGCDKVGDVASGAGSATKTLANKISGGGSSEQQTNNQSASGIIGQPGSDSDGGSMDEEVAEDVPEAAVAESRTGDFNLVFEVVVYGLIQRSLSSTTAKEYLLHDSQVRFL